MPDHAASSGLITAIAKARNVDVILKVVDDSLARAAEARKQREKDEQEQRIKEDRDRRAEEFDRREQQSAAELADREERVARDIAQQEQEAAARRLAIESRPRADGGLDLLF